MSLCYCTQAGSQLTFKQAILQSSRQACHARGYYGLVHGIPARHAYA